MALRIGVIAIALVWGGCGPATPERSDWDGPWRDARGNEVPERILSTFPGPEHCGWQSAVFLSLRRGAPRTYVRDPEGVLAEHVPVPFDEDARLPADASYTGYHLGRAELWVGAKDAARAVYVVRPGRVERWPRFEGACA